MTTDLKRALVLAFLVSALPVPGVAQAPGSEQLPIAAPPLLRIEAGSHSKTIFAISADAAAQFALTASADRTARLWDLKTGKLTQTFHPASGGPDDGSLFAAALSPDGNLVTFGGYTGRLWSGDRSFGFYVYSRKSGSLVQAIGGLQGAVRHLAFSQDGQYLAVSAAMGVSIYRVRDWAVRAFPEGFWADVTSAGPTQAVILTATGMELFVLSNGLWTPVTTAPLDNATSAQTTFSPDGKLILVRSNPVPGQNNLDIFRSPTLEHQYTLQTGVRPANKAIFSKDGRSVLGSLRGGQIGVWPVDGSTPPVLWTLVPDAERGEAPIGDLVSLNNGWVLYTGARSGEWGIAGATPAQTVRVLPNIIDTSVTGIMGLSFDGSEVLYGPDASNHVIFSVPKRTASLGGELDQTSGAATVSKGSVAKSVRYATAQLRAAGAPLPPGGDVAFPIINGVTLQTDPPRIPIVTCFNVTPDAIYLASEATLYGYAADGTRLWKTEISFLPSVIRRSGDGRHLVVAGRDGGFHWYAAATGKFEFNVFVSPDGRWVMWTPSGYYDASPGGEDLIGWQVNRDGKGPVSDFYGGSRFRSRFYRPELFPAILRTGDQADALRSLGTPATGIQTRSVDTGLPPVVTILSPDREASAATDTLTLRYAVTSASGPVTGISVRVDGRPIALGRGLTPADNQVQVPIPPRDCEISITAENSSGVSSPGAVKVHWTGPAGGAVVAAKPTLFVVSVGVSQYQNPALRLGLPAKDAQDMATAFGEQQGKFYGAVRSQVLVDGQATRTAILRALSTVRRDSRPGDFVVVFFAGHGAADDSKSYYYLPVEADPTDLLTTALRFSEISEMVAQIQARTVLFVDTCHSGTFSESRLAAIADINAIANSLSDENVGAVVFTASTGKQLALEDPSWGNGAFTKAVVEGLHGSASDQGEITISTLERWVGKRVSNLTCGRQTPVCAKRVSDFSIANAVAVAAPPAQACAGNGGQ